jgi:RNA polymerase-associated protein CTR9
MMYFTVQNPGEWPAQLLLGLEAINASKNDNLTEEEMAHSFLTGTKLIEKAFNANQKSAAAANALCELFLRKGNYKRVRECILLSFHLRNIDALVGS